MKKIALILLVSLTTALSISPVLFARTPKPSGHSTPAPTPAGTVITSVSGNTITVSDENTSKTVAIGSFTEITLNGQHATLGDLKSGMKVSLGLSDPMHASRVTATTAK